MGKERARVASGDPGSVGTARTERASRRIQTSSHGREALLPGGRDTSNRGANFGVGGRRRADGKLTPLLTQDWHLTLFRVSIEHPMIAFRENAS